MRPPTPVQRKSELAAALGRFRHALIGIGAFTAAINLLQLTGPLFMLEVYDRVIPGRSVPTLVGIGILALVMFGFQGILDVVRGRVLVRIAGSVDEAMSGRIFDLAAKLPLKALTPAAFQPVHDLDRIRSFMSTVGPAAFFDLPWMPFYLGICFAFHPLIGAAASVGGLLLIAITILTEFRSRAPARDAAAISEGRMGLAEASRRNAEAVQAMGMAGRLSARWNEHNRRHLAAQQRVADIAGTMSTLSRILRMVLQSLVLAIGAWLVINQQATAGIIIASSILTSRALAPVEVVLAHWRSFIAARQSWRRLNGLLAAVPADRPRMELPHPSASVTVESVAVMPPGANRIVTQGVTFQLKAGQGLGVIGPSASGKSSLVRAIVGVWPTVQGKIRIDGAAIDQWTPESLGPHMGYLPQDMELFGGTVAENIARFTPDASSDSIIAAARAASVHDLILGLPQGYETQVGDSGRNLSAGQRQRVGLARALYGDPFLVVLDEPNSNLDREGDEALTKAILGVRARGGIVIVVAHRPAALAGVDMVLVMLNGQQQAFGPKEAVLQPQPAGQVPGQNQAPAAAYAPAARMVTPMTVRAAPRPQENTK
ncbi:type I secretion system permease/ATPase [Reyranella sp.]|uniref:type I secretion system permease/ATPase n=1 Tax=Reyranella sp. TaxID=1929291 RepID=UPI003BAB7B14